MTDRIPTGDLDEAVPGHTVKPLSRLHGYRIVEGDPDVRGWEVHGADGEKVGEVSELLVDIEAGRVRYLDVAVELDAKPRPPSTSEPDLLGEPVGVITAHAAMAGLAPLITETVVRSTLSDEENALTREHHYGLGTHHVLIPIGHARLDPEHDRVILEELTAGQIAELPDYEYGDLDRETEARLRQAFERFFGRAPEDDFYGGPAYDQDRFYAPRRQEGRGRAATDTARMAGLESGDAEPAHHDHAVTGRLD